MIKGIFTTYKNDELIDEGPNNVTNNGRKWFIDRWVANGSVLAWEATTAMLAFGEGSGTTLPNMSGLISELGIVSGNRTTFINVSRVVDAGSVITGSASLTFPVGGNLWEVGLFVTGFDNANVLQDLGSDPNTGMMFGRRTFNSVQQFVSGDKINIQYKYTVWDS